MNYRIKEQYGYFVIQKQIESEEIEHTFLSYVFPRFFKPKRIKTYKWFSISDDSGLICFKVYTNPLKFSSLESAMNYITALEPKYHEVTKVDKQDKFPSPTDSDVVNAAIKSVENDGFKVIAVETQKETLKVTDGIVDPFCVCYVGNGVYNCDESCKKQELLLKPESGLILSKKVNQDKNI